MRVHLARPLTPDARQNAVSAGPYRLTVLEDPLADPPPGDPANPLVVADAAAWRRWLDEHEDLSDGVWLLLAKKGVTTPTSLGYVLAVDEAVCSGWIDGQSKGIDDRTYRQRFTPRRARSLWSRANVDRVARLTQEGRMRPRGLAEVQRAQQDGRWQAAYAGPATIEVPAELAAALAANDTAAARFASLDSRNRYAVLLRIVTLRTERGRAAAVARQVTALERGDLPYPTSGAPPGETRSF